MSDPVPSYDDITQALRWAYSCHEEVTRRGELQPCDLDAVALRVDEEGGCYPVCIKHTRKPMVPLERVAR